MLITVNSLWEFYGFLTSNILSLLKKMSESSPGLVMVWVEAGEGWRTGYIKKNCLKRKQDTQLYNEEHVFPTFPPDRKPWLLPKAGHCSKSIKSLIPYVISYAHKFWNLKWGWLWIRNWKILGHKTTVSIVFQEHRMQL